MLSIRSMRVIFATLPMACLLLLASTHAAPQKSANKKAGPGPGASDLLKPSARPMREPLPPSRLPLELIKGERIAFVGNSTAERMSLFGHFETLLQLRFPDKELVVRNFGRPAEEVNVHQRSADYTRLDDPLRAFNPDTFFCFFGWNESFAGKDGLSAFQAEYERFLDEYAKKYTRDDAKSPPRFVLVSPIAFEPSGDKFLPEGSNENANLKLYADAVKAVAAKRKVAFIDLYTPTLAAFTSKPGLQYTIDSCHANDAGDQLVANILSNDLFGGPLKSSFSQYEKLRAAVVDKAFIHQQDYRMVNGWYVYGGRRTFDTETFPREYIKLRNMAHVRDLYIWDIARGKKVADKPDDSQTGDLVVPPTRFGVPQQKYSEAPELRYLTSQEFLKTCTTPPDLEIKLFADETMFPELAKPVQLNFDNKGRLWVACMPNYPQWKPGDPKPNDRLLILEDTNGDGKADKCTVFYDQLHCPTGFEFWNGGVLVMDQPRILWLKDTDGDGKADVVVHLFDGWATDDTHHRGGWEWSPGGKLHILEGISTSTTLETPWGAHRSLNTGGAYVIDPRSLKIRQFALPGMYNMWCYVFDEWGQGIVGDGTTPNQTWDVPLSGAQFPGRKGVNFILPNGVRPNLGSEWLVSRNLPDYLQKQFTYACVIQMNGLTRYSIADDGAGYKGERVRVNGKFSDLVHSTDQNFRPSDPQIGPDGALWFGDWANALIGHMQYSQRDPNRDHQHGRIYRLVGKGIPLVTPVTQFGKSVPEILEQFREYEWRTRYRARRELRDRPEAEVLEAVKVWLAKLEQERQATTEKSKIERLRCEALWLQQSFHAVDPVLLKSLLKSEPPEARAAAVHVVAEERDYIPESLALLRSAVSDSNPRVRTEALRGLSFFQSPEAIDAVLAAAKMPLDYWTRYTLEATLGATESIWRPAYLAGKLDKSNTNANKIMGDILASSKVGGAATPHLQLLLGTEPQTVETRSKAINALATMKGNPSNGRAVFTRNCTACHKVGNGEGQEYGPNMAEVGKRLTRFKIVESIIDPNAEVDPKYASTRINTLDGKTIIGLVVEDTKKQVVIFDGKEKKTIPLDEIDSRQTLKQSSMPEGQAGAMSPSEFLDLIEYLTAQK